METTNIDKTAEQPFDLAVELTNIQKTVNKCVNMLDKPHSNYVHIAVGSLKNVSSELTDILKKLNK